MNRVQLYKNFLICWFIAQETFICIIINVDNSWTAFLCFVETILLFLKYMMSRTFKEQHLCVFIFGNIINVFTYFWSI